MYATHMGPPLKSCMPRPATSPASCSMQICMHVPDCAMHAAKVVDTYCHPQPPPLSRRVAAGCPPPSVHVSGLRQLVGRGETNSGIIFGSGGPVEGCMGGVWMVRNTDSHEMYARVWVGLSYVWVCLMHVTALFFPSSQSHLAVSISIELQPRPSATGH